MTDLHKYLHDFLDESAVKFVKIFNGENVYSTSFFLVSNVIYEISVPPELRDICTTIYSSM
jgi:hypothetical protein